MLDAQARLGHPVGNGRFPAKVMHGLLVLREVVPGVVGFVEQEAIGIFFGTKDVKAEVAGLFARALGVVEGGLDELLRKTDLFVCAKMFPDVLISPPETSGLAEGLVAPMPKLPSFVTVIRLVKFV